MRKVWKRWTFVNLGSVIDLRRGGGTEVDVKSRKEKAKAAFIT